MNQGGSEPRRPQVKRTLALLFVIVAVAAGMFFAGWYPGYDSGHERGYQEGSDAAWGAGYQVGRNAAWEQIQAQYLLLRDPSYEEMSQFLESDDTDKNEWVWPNYVCMHFARDVNEAATAAGIRCAYVYIDYYEMEWSHFLVAFETTDNGLIFIEPQTDEEMRVEPGNEYVTVDGYPFFGSTTINRVVIAW